MGNYLGEFPVDISAHPVFKHYTPAHWAMYFVETYGQIDGAHHKQWVLDQVARCLQDVPIVIVEARWANGEREYRVSTAKETSVLYQQWVTSMLGDYSNGEYEYSYDEGCPP